MSLRIPSEGRTLQAQTRRKRADFEPETILSTGPSLPIRAPDAGRGIAISSERQSAEGRKNNRSIARRGSGSQSLKRSRR
jgi:hypothetical protein